MPRRYFNIKMKMMEMNSFPLRLESILVFLINQMQDTRRKIEPKTHGKKLIIQILFHGHDNVYNGYISVLKVYIWLILLK